MERLLDSQPKVYKPVTLGIEESMGLRGSIKRFYAEMLDKNEPYGQILIGDATVTVAPECVAMLKAILYSGCCKIEERAMACKKAFEKCVLAESKGQFVEILAPEAKNDPWVNEICLAIKELW